MSFFAKQGLQLALGFGLTFVVPANHDPESAARETAVTLRSRFNETSSLNRETPYWSVNTRMRPGTTREDFLTSRESVGRFVHMQRFGQDGFFITQDSMDALLDVLVKDRKISRSLRDDIRFYNWEGVSDKDVHELYRHIKGQVTKKLWKSIESGHDKLIASGVTDQNARMIICRNLFGDENFFSLRPTEDGDTIFCKIPGNYFDIDRIARDICENSGLSENYEYRTAPGTSREWALLIAAHEFEHAAGKGQRTIHDQAAQFFQNVQAYVQENPDDEQAQIVAKHFDNEYYQDQFKIQLIEIESDLAAAQVTQGIVAPEIHEYWAALRVARSSSGNMSEALQQAHKNESGEDFYLCNVRDHHDTGFFLDHYLQTVEMPDYFEMQTNVSGFYLNTAQFIRDTIRTEMETRAVVEGFDGLDYKGIETPTASQIMTVIEQALHADTPVYTPQEQVIASRYLVNMREQLGVLPEPLFTSEYFLSIEKKSKTKLDELNKEKAETAASPDQTPDKDNNPQTLEPPGV
nr:hypothetical protein [Cytophagales bacterium]